MVRILKLDSVMEKQMVCLFLLFYGSSRIRNRQNISGKSCFSWLYSRYSSPSSISVSVSCR